MQHVVSTAARAIPLVPVFIGIHDYVGSINSVTGRSMQRRLASRSSASHHHNAADARRRTQPLRRGNRWC
jgi:hypothetical protein